MQNTLLKAGSILLVLLVICQAALFLPFVPKADARSERKADIVFVIDTTGSMGGVINNVKDNINQFVDILAEQNINARLGLVTFKDIYADGQWSTNNLGWFANPNDFKNTLAGIRADGGGDEPESAVDGLEEARRMVFQQLAKKHMILVTDVSYKEGTRFDANGDYITMNREISLLKNDHITVSVVAPGGIETIYQNLYSGTNGIFTNISTAFSSNLRALTNRINTNNVPSFSVVSPDANPLSGQSGTEIVPKIVVSDPDGDALVANYYLDGETTPRDSRTMTNTTTAQTVNFNGLAISEVGDGSHTIRIEVTDNWSDPIMRSVPVVVDKSPPSIGNIAASSTDTTITVGGEAADAVSGLSPLPYRYSMGSQATSWTSDSFTFTNLTPNTAYNVNVEARDRLDNMGSRQQSVYTQAQAPTIAVASSAESTLALQITDNNPAGTLYQIRLGESYVSASGSLTGVPGSINLFNKQMVVNGLTANSTYNIQAVAINQQGMASSWSGLVPGTTVPSAPINLAASRTQTTITLSWPATRVASGYEIEADGVVMNNGAGTSYTHGDLAPESKHTYRLRARNAGGLSQWSQALTVFSLPYPPSAPMIADTSSLQTEVTVSWDRVAKADSYDLEADGIIIVLADQTSYTHSGLGAETMHTYRIRANNIGGSSTWSQPVTKQTLPYPPETPVDIQTALTYHSVTVTWEGKERAVAYEIEVDGVLTENEASTTYVDEGLEPLSGHTYRVRAKNAGGKSLWSVPVHATTHPDKPMVPSNLMATSDETSISVTWYKVLHAEAYEVELDGQSVTSTTYAQFTHPDLTPDSLHTYRVRAKNISGYSEWSLPVKMSTLPVAQDGGTMSLTNIAAIVTNTNITFSWDTVAPDAEYDIEADGTIQSNGKNTIYHHAGLKPNEFHTYKVRVRKGDQPGAWVAVLSLSTLPNPPDALVGLNALASNRSIELRWDKVNGATGYDLEIDGKTVNLNNISDYMDKDLQPGTSHTYRVRAKNVTGVTAWSPSIVRSTTSPTYSVQAVQDRPFSLLLFAYNVQDFGEKTFVVAYDPNVLEVDDLYEFTAKKEMMASGKMPGTPLHVQATPGRIEYKVSRNIIPGTSWSGEITTVVFKAKQSGSTNLDVTME